MRSFRRGGDRRRAGGRGGGGAARRARAGGRDRRGPAGRRRVLVLGVHAVEGAAAARTRRSPRSSGSPARPRRSPASSTSPAVLARRDEIIHDLDDAAQLPWLEDRGIDADPRPRPARRRAARRRVGDEELEAAGRVPRRRHRSPTMPPIDGPGRDRRRRGRTARRRPPRRSPSAIVILGGGVVGVEMAQAFQTLGARSR